MILLLKTLKTHIFAKKNMLNCGCNANCWPKIKKIVKFGLSIENRCLLCILSLMYLKNCFFRCILPKNAYFGQKNAKLRLQRLMLIENKKIVKFGLDIENGCLYYHFCTSKIAFFSVFCLKTPIFAKKR